MRLESLERRFRRNSDLKKAYVEFMKDYIKQEHMTLIEDAKGLESREVYFMSHQAVFKPDSITTQVRVVFDASAKISNGISLNDKLLTGPNLQGDLFKIIVRFRTHEFVITADVEMFRQGWIHQDDRLLQVILERGCNARYSSLPA